MRLLPARSIASCSKAAAWLPHSKGFDILAFLLLVFLCAPVLAQQDFKWSWEDKKGEPSTTGNGPRTTDPKTGPDKDFRWSWEKGDPGAGVKPPVTPPAVSPPRGQDTQPKPAPVKPGGISASAYNELLADNLELRRKAEAAELAGQKAKREEARLKRDAADMERRLTQMVARIKALQQQKGADPSGDLDKVMQLEAELTAARQEKTGLQKQIEALGLQIAAARAEGARAAADQGPTMAPGSDLLRDLERENRTLKNKLVDVETARQKLERGLKRLAQENTDEKRRRARLEGQLAQAKADTRRYQRAAKTLQKEIPRLKKRLGEEKRAAPRTRLDPSRKLTATSKEQRDMHYNMGILLQQEGRHKEAEKEYLRAMRIDPSDAEVHYNLGVLYDDNLDNDSRAAVHYRVYLRIKPSAEDSAQVQEWLAAIEGE